jgi:fluoride ion exporter CrcB/FEX
MSSFALEVNNLLDNKQIALAAVSIFMNVGLSILSVLGGRVLVSILLYVI